jgi:hypothetical protein
MDVEVTREELLQPLGKNMSEAECKFRRRVGPISFWRSSNKDVNWDKLNEMLDKFDAKASGFTGIGQYPVSPVSS